MPHVFQIITANNHDDALEAKLSVNSPKIERKQDRILRFELGRDIISKQNECVQIFANCSKIDTSRNNLVIFSMNVSTINTINRDFRANSQNQISRYSQVKIEGT